jgi:ribonuclease HI
MHDIDMLLYFITPNEDKNTTNQTDTNNNEAELKSAMDAFKAAKDRDFK